MLMRPNSGPSYYENVQHKYEHASRCFPNKLLTIGGDFQNYQVDKAACMSIGPLAMIKALVTSEDVTRTKPLR